MTDMSKSERVKDMYVKKDKLSTRMGLHQKYSENKYGWFNWVFDQYDLHFSCKILELGCGTGTLWKDRELPEEVEVTLADYSPLMLDKCKELLGHRTNLAFKQMDIQEIPYADQTFDIVIANHMLYHVPDKQKALGEVRRVLKEHGVFYATTLGENTFHELNAIYHQMDNKIKFTYMKDNSFTLENGRVQLEKHFSMVEIRRYIDALNVTNVDDLMDYVLSYNHVPEEHTQELYTRLKSGFVDGVFHISKDTGIFISKK